MYMKKIAIFSFLTLCLAACNQTSNSANNELRDEMNQAGEQINQETQEAADTLQNATDTDDVTVLTLSSQNDSGQEGTATITKVNETQTKVVLDLSGGSYTLPQPAHIHTGTCQEPGPVVYPLTNVVDGKSETILNASYQDVIDPKDAEYIVNVHESAAKQTVYTACAEWDD